METLTAVITNLPLPLYATSVLLHSIGIYLLFCKRHRRNQDIILIHLSISEIGINIFDITQNIMTRSQNNKRVVSYLIVINCSFFVIPFLLIVILLTVDRFLEVFLNIKYQIYFNKSKTVILLLSGWGIGLFTGVPLIWMKWRYDTKVRHIIYRVMFPLYESIFLIIATCTYTYIYKKYRESLRHRPSLGRITSLVVEPWKTEGILGSGGSKGNTDCSNNKKRTIIFWRKRILPICQTKGSNGKKQKTEKRINIKKKNLFAPSLIIITFVLFVIVPDILNLFLFYVFKNNGSPLLSNILLCLYGIGFIADALI